MGNSNTALVPAANRMHAIEMVDNECERQRIPIYTDVAYELMVLVPIMRMLLEQDKIVVGADTAHRSVHRAQQILDQLAGKTAQPLDTVSNGNQGEEA